MPIARIRPTRGVNPCRLSILLNLILKMAVRNWYIYFIGTDVSRDKLDHAVMQGNILLFHKEILNNPIEIKQFLIDLKKLPKFSISKTLFCMEHTGMYSNHFVVELQKVRANVVIEAALQIKNSLGILRGKNDKLDAIRIADYAYRSKEHHRMWRGKRQIIVQLAGLITLRNRMLNLIKMIRTPLIEESLFINRQLSEANERLCCRSQLALKDDLVEIENAIKKVINSDERISRLMEIITSVACIGPITALNIIVCTNEFQRINSPKQFACYAGVAPFVKESGKRKGKAMVSQMANKKMKSLLHLCAIVAKTHSPDLKTFFLRKTLIEGKNKMSVINSIRYKLILRIFACVNQNRLYKKDYDRSTT